MRLMVPATTTSVMVLKGPGVTEIFEKSLEKTAEGYREPAGPILRYTIEDPFTMKPMEIGVEMIGNWKKVDGHFELYACHDGQYITVKDWLRKDETGYRGIIADI